MFDRTIKTRRDIKHSRPEQVFKAAQNKKESVMKTKYRTYTTIELLVMDYDDHELVNEICNRAGLLKEFRDSDEETFKNVLDRAVKILSDREGIRTFSFWAGL